jgi:hypothetical protein
VGSLDLPDEPDEPSRAEHASADGADRLVSKSREMPDPDERGRVYEAMQARISAYAAYQVSPGRRPDGSEQRNYWSEVPRFRDMWVDHERRWPERQPAAETGRSADPSGWYRSKGGFKMNPERHAETVEAIGRVRETERTISASMRTIEKENTYGGWLAGFDHRIKGDDRLKEKVAEQAAAEPDKSSSAILRKIPDALRFTCSFEPNTYTEGYYDVEARLRDLGHQMYQSANYWADSEYKGINTRWVTPHGQRFEVQFHTPESFHAKEHVTHGAYERLRNPQITDEERRELEAFQRGMSSWIQVPDGAIDISDFKKEGF